MFVTINGFSSGSLSGCQLVDIGQVKAAEPRVAETITVYGANGQLRVLDGAFDGYERELVFLIKDLAQVDRLLEAFGNGKAEIGFWYQLDSIYYGACLGSYYEPWGLHRYRLVIKVYMYPFRYLKAREMVVLGATGTVVNPGTVFSEPTIVIEGNGEVSLTIGRQTMHLTLDTKATIICRHGEQKILDKSGQVKNTIRRRGPFFELPVGRSGVSSSGHVTKVSIQGNWRYRI